MKKALVAVAIILPLLTSAQQPDPSPKRVTVLLSDISLEKALTILSISYNVRFSYSDDAIPINTIVNLSIQDETLSAALDQLLSPYMVVYKMTSGNRIVLRRDPAMFTQRIRGTVIDQVTSMAIPGATIVVQNTEPLVGTTADDKGVFTLHNAPIGRLSLQFGSVGYKPKVIAGVLVGTGKELILNVELAESITEIDEVVITGLPHNSSEIVPTGSPTFTAEESKRYAGSLGDPARMASGFAAVTGMSDQTNALVVRGNSPRGVLWRIDGIEVPNPNHFATEGSSAGVISILSANVIDQTSFLTGPFAAPIGNALSSVFDIRMRNGNDKRREHSLQLGLLGLEASTEGPFGNNQDASYLFNYRYSTLSVLDKLGSGLNEAGQYKDYQDAALKLNYKTKLGTFSVFGLGAKSSSNQNDTTVLDNNNSDVGMLTLTHKHRVANTLFSSALSYSGTNISRYSEIQGESPIAIEENYQKSYTRLMLSATTKLSDNISMQAGTVLSRLLYDFRMKSVDPGNPIYQVVQNFDEQDKGDAMITQAYASIDHTVNEKLTASYGLHFMKFGLTKDLSLEPRAGLQYHFNPRQSLSIAYGKHSRIENLQYYLARQHQTGGNEIQINRNLGFTRSHQASISYQHELPKMHKLTANVYVQQLFNAPVQADPAAVYSSINEDTGFTTDSLINNGRGRNYGVELSLERSFSNDIYYILNGSVYRSLFSVNGETYQGSPYDGVYSFHTMVGKEFRGPGKSGRFGVNLKFSTGGGRRYIPIDLNRSVAENRQVYTAGAGFDGQLPVYYRADCQLVYRVNRDRCMFEWRLDVQNVTNHKNAAYFYYDNSIKGIRLKEQVGLIPLLSFRVEF